MIESGRGCRTMISIGRHGSVEFLWGVSDCSMFAAKVCDDVTGSAYAEHLRYETYLEAARILRRYGGLENLVTSLLRESPPVTPQETDDGDPVLLVGSDGREVLGVRFAAYAVYKTLRGVMHVPVSEASCGWRVPCL